MTTSNKKNRKQKTSPALNICVVILVVIASFMLMSLFSGCRAAKPVVTNSLSSTEKYIEKDKLTPAVVPGESAGLQALFECDSLNNVLLKNFNELKSKNMSSKFSFANGALKYNAKTHPDTIYVRSTDHWYYINREIKTTITITRKVATYINKFGLLDWIGLINIIAVGGWLVYKLFTKTTALAVFKKLLKIN